MSISTRNTAQTGVPVGLRERQKVKRQAAILNAARELFPSLGYQGTSMEAIAETAEVGVATVYNYFGTKGGLLAAILRPEFTSLKEQGARLLAEPGTDSVTSVQALVNIYRHFQNDWASRKLLSAIIGPGLSAEPILDQLSEEAESQLKAQLRELLLGYQERGQILSSIDADDAAMIVFCIFNQHFIDYVMHDNHAFDSMAADMDRQIKLLITGISC